MKKSKGETFWRLRYLYIGTSNVQKDVDYYTKVLGAKKTGISRVSGLESPPCGSVKALSFFSQIIGPRLAAY